MYVNVISKQFYFDFLLKILVKTAMFNGYFIDINVKQLYSWPKQCPKKIKIPIIVRTMHVINITHKIGKAQNVTKINIKNIR